MVSGQDCRLNSTCNSPSCRLINQEQSFFCCNFIDMILIIDDDLAVRTSLSLLFSCNGFEPQSVATPDEALAIVRRSKPQLILLDLNFSLNISGEEGLELLSKIRIFQPQVPVVLITAWGSIQLAVEGMKRGAVNFITKPWNNFQLLDVVRTSIELAASEPSMTDNHREAIKKIKAFDSIVGRSPKLIAILNSILRVAPTNASVLITGESGTGKEMIAQAIHELSKRKGHPFVKVNLGGLTQSLFESEMFGHRKGAFTDAYADRKGRFELADKGTIFLDEIGDLDPLSQVKLLRVLQDQTFEPLGDSRPKTVDVRVVCATNRDLPQLIKAGSFREDLYYRINLITLHLPSLRERIEDIPLLAESFLANIAERENRAGLMISPDGKEWLMQQNYPGNIRQLKNLIERAALLSSERSLTASQFKSMIESEPTHPGSLTQVMSLDAAEKEVILKAIQTYPNNLTRVAKVLGISRGALYRRLDKFNIPYESKS